MIAIVDYGVGNLFSLSSSFRILGQEVVVTGEKKVLQQADRILLPGVGAFEDAVRKLKQSGLFDLLREEAKKGKPLLGICLGMQLLFEKSYEYGEHEGLGLIPGSIRPISDVIPKDLKIPHIGWNALRFTEQKSPLFSELKDGDCVYFVHSYSAQCPAEYVTSYAEYGAMLTDSVQKGNVLGCQFHPEKSGEAGLRILRAFCELEDVKC